MSLLSTSKTQWYIYTYNDLEAVSDRLWVWVLGEEVKEVSIARTENE